MLRLTANLVLLLGLLAPIAAMADPFENLSKPLWSDGCAQIGVAEVDHWVVISKTEWCEEFVGDFGRVQSTCFEVDWLGMGTNRWIATFASDGRRQTLELVAPNRLSLFSGEAPDYRQDRVLGRALHFKDVESLYVKCE